MLTWGQAKDYMASLFAMPNWDRMSQANQRIGQMAINQAVSRVWYAVNPMLKVKDDSVWLREDLSINIQAAKDHTYVDTNSTVPGTIMFQKLFFNNEQHEIRHMEIYGGGTRIYFTTPVQAGFQGTGEIHHVHYLLPPDFEGFEEIPAEIIRSGGDATPEQFYSRNELVIEPRQVVQDYVSTSGNLTISRDPNVGYVLQGDRTAFTDDIVDQLVLCDGRFWHIRSVDTTTQILTAWNFVTTTTGHGDLTSHPVPFEVKLQPRRLLRVYAASNTHIPYTYRILPPVQGREDSVIPIPSDRALHLWMQFYWIVGSDSGSMMSSNYEKAMLQQEAEKALQELSRSTIAYPGGPEHIEIRGTYPADRARSDPRISYDPRDRRAFTRPARPSVDIR
jgi:hypothetical protein